MVNGPGKSKAANIGISLPGTGEAPSCPVYVDGVKYASFKGTPEELAAQFEALIEEYVATRYPPRPPLAPPTPWPSVAPSAVLARAAALAA